ncbi:MAG: intradiol ring-cleavage dioxygenase, partial [Acidimicrobiales bacterium]
QPPGTFRVLSRREALTLLGMAGVALFPACASGKSPSAGSAAGATSTTAAGSSAGASTSVAPQTAACVLAREATEGPFYLDIDKVRSDITEGRPGAPLELQITVVAADGCAPIPDAAVDIWHTDAGGLYSGVGQGGGADSQTFLRGTQLSDANGLTTLRTIYPGWYMGRAVHIHMKVHVSGAEVHTGQLFFDDDFTRTAYQAAPYNARPGPNQTNAEDGIHRSAGAASAIVPVVAQGNGHVGRIVVGVKQAGTANRA